MPPIAKHSPAKLFFYSTLAAIERPLRSRPSLRVEDLRGIRNFLFLQYDTPLGSAVHATPLFAALRTALPDAQIALAASPMAASVCAHNPHINSCTVTADPMHDFFGALRDVHRIYEQLPAGEVCIATTLGNQRSRLAFLAALTGRAVRVGYMLATPMFDFPLEYHFGISQIDANLEILRTLGHAAYAQEPQVFFTSQDREHAGRLLRAADPSDERARIVFVTQNSGGQPNQWREQRFQQVIDTLATQCDAEPIFVGGAKESARIERLRAGLRQQGSNLAGKTTVPQLAAVLSQCDLVVSLDTGTFHVARAVGLPGSVIAPGWQDPIEWLPQNHPRYRVLWNGPTPENPAQPYLDEISVEQVLAAANDLLVHFPPSQAARTERMAAALSANAAEPVEAHG